MHEYTHTPGFIDNECMDRGQTACLLPIHTCVTLACVLIAVIHAMYRYILLYILNINIDIQDASIHTYIYVYTYIDRCGVYPVNRLQRT